MKDDSIVMTRRRANDAPGYNPEHERQPSPWNRLDTNVQRFIAVATAFAILLGVCAWAANTIGLDTRVTKLEVQQTETNDLLRANLAVSCILTRKVDPTIEPAECNPRRPK